MQNRIEEDDMESKDAQAIADAINNLAAAIREAGKDLSESISIDEPLNYSVARGLDRISQNMPHHS